ncbi:MAG: NAD(P)-dependent glycerol-3-phosphate dehydrogenase [Coriobacteriaceae bacterium]|nr:NAD(P)-dependent glycerol-3-phosphate dehydrogenase [Coriobacteriaceae bacterium]
MHVAVIGAGSWGTALAQVAARNGHDVSLWARRESVAQGINEQHRNPDYLSDADLSERITASADLETVVRGCDAIISVTPSKFVRQTAESLAACGISCTTPIVVCTKGVEGETGKVPVQIFEELLGNAGRLAALSGPNHAEEIVMGVPAGTVVASASPDTARFFQDLLGQPAFRVYTSDDVLGVEICAAFKNVIAIAVGVSYGLGYGDNTAAMIMTRGQAEMGRLVDAAGGNAMTCMGLAGTGDLIATCMSRHSRNRMFGEALARGVTVEEYEAERHMVVEGAQAARTIGTLATRYGVELPITDVVYEVVWGGLPLDRVAGLLASRSPKPEFY